MRAGEVADLLNLVASIGLNKVWVEIAWIDYLQPESNSRYAVVLMSPSAPKHGVTFDYFEDAKHWLKARG